jgi:4-amino-4-deoxy-L-arabinose transferase-like glycosyltransferase
METVGFLKKHAALLLSVCFCGIIFFTLNDYGITWDEGGYYFKAGDSYFHWLRNPSWQTINTYWEWNHEHPPLAKVLGGMTKYLFHEKLHLLNSISSFRLSVLIFVFFSTYFLFSFVSKLLNHNIAFLTTAAFFFLPRVFFHSHLGAMDYPITVLWFLVIYFYWKGMNKTKWIFVASILLGFALLTKVNAFLLYIPILFCWVLNYRGQLKTMPSQSKSKYPETHRIFNKIIPMVIIPPIIFIAFWPWLWTDTLQRLSDYLSFHRHHAVVYTYYWGAQSPIAPWHYPLVLTAITIPLVIFVPFIIGMVRIIFRPDKTKIFLLFNALFPLLLISLPSVPKYDGVRLFLPAFPFICMIAGIGLHYIFEFKKWKAGNFFFLLYTVIFMVTIHASIIKPHPYQSSYFNELIGGVDGAVKKGFEAEYWGNAYIGVLPWMNQHPRSTFWVYMADLEPKVLWGFDLYKENRMLDQGVKFGNKKNSDYLILLIRQGFFNEEMWGYFRYEKPVFSVRLSKTNLVNIYRIK